MIQINSKRDRRIQVDDRRAIDFMGPELRVYGTPSMIEDMEMAARELLLEMLESGQDSVGTRVEFSHDGPARLGEAVELEIAIVEAEGKRVVFTAEFRANGQAIASGRHERAVVSVERLKQRLAGK